MQTTVIWAFLAALLLAVVLVPLCRALARRIGYEVGPVVPPGRRRPAAGGVAILLSVAITTAAAGGLREVAVLVACGALLCLVGIVSDLRNLKPATKLVAIIGVASVFLFNGFRLHWTDSLTLDSLITVLWIVGVTSAFDLLDNMDGLASGIAVIAGTAFLLTVLPAAPDDPLFPQVDYLVILLGAITGFLFYNVHPATAVLGHGGSLLLGLNMAAMTLQFAPGRGSDLASIVAVPLLVLLIPIGDTALVAVTRMLRGTPPGGGDQSSQRLLAMGLSERAAVSLLWSLAAVSGVIAVIADRAQQGLAELLAAMFTIGLALFAAYLARVEIRQGADARRGGGAATTLSIELGYRRRLAEVLLDFVLVTVAYYGAYRLRFEGLAFVENFDYFAQSLPLVLGTQMVVLFAVGAYRGMWRYFSLSDGVTFLKGTLLGVIAAQAAVFYVYRFAGYSTSVFVIYGLLLLVLLVGSRASFRLVSEFVHRQRQGALRLVIYGAGDAGAMAVRHLLTDPHSSYRIAGFIDDDLRKRHVRVHGYQVIGGYDHLVGLILAEEIDAVVITQDGAETPGLAALCGAHGVRLHRLSLDWSEIPAFAERAAGAEGRVLSFTDSRPALAYVGAAPAPARVEASAAPVRVAHVITRLILGGAQENTLYTAIGQHQDRRFDVTLICGVDEAGEGNMFPQVTGAGVKTVVLPSLIREIRPFTDAKALVQLYRLLKRGGYTVVHTHSSKAGITGRLAAWAAGVPVVVHTIHGVAFHEFQSEWKNRLFIALERLCAPLSDRIISVSQRLSDAAVAHRIGRADQHVTIFSGIELDLFLNARDRLSVAEAKRRAGIPAEAPVVGKVARMFELKGHDQFLAAAAVIAREVPGAYFLLVGDGPLRDHLRVEAERMGIGDRLVMVGRVPPEAVPDYIQAMDVVVHTSLREGIARVLPQAGAVGKPVVTFELDGAPEVIRDGVSGYLVPPVDVAAVAERVVTLLCDPERRRAFGEAGRAFAAEHFSVERMVERISGLYLELLDRPSTPAAH